VFDLKDDLGDSCRVKLPHPEILNTLRVGDTLLLDDGKLRMKVTETTMATSPPNEGSVTCQVVIGGVLSNKKGVNTPTIVLPISPLTPKDRRFYIIFCSVDLDYLI
jgi:pyruvate kinase